MHKQIKLSMVLAVLQVALAAILFQWSYRIEAGIPPGFHDAVYVSTPKFLCWGLNAPAFWVTFILDVPLQTWIPSRILGFVSRDFVFMIGVGLTWFIVGRALDNRDVRSASTRARRLMDSLRRVALVLLACWSVVFGIRALQIGQGNNPLSPIWGILVLVWAGGLFANAKIPALAAIQISASLAIANWLDHASRLQSHSSLLVYPALLGSLLFLIGGLISIVRHKYGVALGMFAACLSWPCFANVVLSIPWRNLTWVVMIWCNDLCAIVMLALATIYLLTALPGLTRAQKLPNVVRS